MAISLSSISKGKAAKAPRIVLLGVEKIGKSRFAAAAPSPIFIPIKGEQGQGLDFIDAAKFPVCDNYGALMECLASLCNEKHDFKTVGAEGCANIAEFRKRWEQINGNWRENCWVWVIGFEVIKNG